MLRVGPCLGRSQEIQAQGSQARGDVCSRFRVDPRPTHGGRDARGAPSAPPCTFGDPGARERPRVLEADSRWVCPRVQARGGVTEDGTKTDSVSECAPRSSPEQRTVPGVCPSRKGQDEGDEGSVRRTKVAAERVRVRAGTCRAREPAGEVCWAAPQTAFRRERRILKVSARECVSARARVRGRGSKQQQHSGQLRQ